MKGMHVRSYIASIISTKTTKTHKDVNFDRKKESFRERRLVKIHLNYNKT